ncbi:Protein CBG04790 [Caenorhabditis briggsae]|uniref:Protein CBG04790 n=1 Tax=Caenorhabditis briggsae TaxID=6238 RepID=A8WYH2_CAEBR|nr:Protein CBG04790 [Caenorhabditis briggsae]CAP25430.2 Protein CBG04790 [Caenorhabditis briggsae]
MENISVFLKNNHHYLKSCILYEVALKKPIFDSYRIFCDAVGHDAMEYRDFEFWYHRFGLGELDFDYDRSMNPVPKTLMDMPVNLMRKITEILDPFEKRSLRSTNRDSLPSVFEIINITTSEEKMEWESNDELFECSNYGMICSVSNSKIYKTNERCYIKKSLEYLTPLFKIPNLYVNSLCFSKAEEDNFFGERRKMPDLDDLLSTPFHIVSSFEEFESCQMSFSYHMDRYPIENVAEKMVHVEIPEENPEDPFEMFTHRFQIPQSNEHLQFRIEDKVFRCFINISKIL